MKVMPVIPVILLLLFTTSSHSKTDHTSSILELYHRIPQKYFYSFFNDHVDYFVENQEVMENMKQLAEVFYYKSREEKLIHLQTKFRLSAREYGLYEDIFGKFLKSPNKFTIGEHYKNCDKLFWIIFDLDFLQLNGAEDVYGNERLKATSFPQFFRRYIENAYNKFTLHVSWYSSQITYYLTTLSEEQHTILLEMLRTMSEMDEKTLDDLFKSLQRVNSKKQIQVPEVKNKQVKKVLWAWHTLGWMQYEEAAVVFLQSIEPNLHIFTGKLTQETLESLSNEELVHEKKAVDDLLEFGCGDLKMDIFSVLGKFSPKFLRVVGNIDMKTDSDRKKEDELNDADFQTATEIFRSYKSLDEEQDNKLMDLLQDYRFFGARTFFQQMKSSGKYTMRTMSSALKEMRSCSRQKMEDVLVMAKAWKSGINTKEASDRLRALFEASKCEMLREVSLEREKAIDQVVGILENSFEFVSCKRKGVEKVEVNKTSEAVKEFVKGLNNSPVVFDDWISDALNNTSDQLLKTSAKLSEGCQNLLKLAEAPFKIGTILNSMPEPKLLQGLNSNRSWPELSELSQNALNLLQKFEDLKVAEQEQLVQHHPMLQQLSDARHSLLDLTSCATRLAACGRLEEFLEVLSIWRLASEEARTRVLRLLEVSSCEVVDELANGGEQVDKLVALLDKYFGTESCVAKKAKEDRTKHYTDFK